MHFSTLFIGCALYLCIQFSDAKLGEVTSLVATVVQRSVASRSTANARTARHKRDVITKNLEDKDSCIYDCYDTETQAIMSATMKNVARLVGLALQDIDGDELDTPEKEEAFKRKVEAKTIANMGPMFDDFCKTAKNADACYAKCPDSQLRTIMTLHHTDAEAFCEPSKNWGNFSDYWDAVNCTNTTEAEKPCEKKCGVELPVANATHLTIEPDTDGTEVRYEEDVKKNNDAVAASCKTYSCEIACYKPLMTEKCGKKAYDLYVSMTRVEPKSSLAVAKELKIVDDDKQCQDFI